MTKWLIMLLAYIYIVGQTLGDIHPIDVEPVMKKEQPDFEDDTGLAQGSLDVFNGKSKEASEAGELVTRFAHISNYNFTQAFVASLSVIVVSELGDKTFFIAAIMAMNHPRITVFVAAMAALALMHIMSALFGYVITYIPRVYTFYASTALFVIFGLKMLIEGYKMKPTEAQEELEEVQMEIRRRDDTEREAPSIEEGGNAVTSQSISSISCGRSIILKLVSRIFVQAFTMTFLAEWGDRSQIATVILASREDVYGIIVGGLLGHFLCTGLAVVGGRMIASRISVRTVTIIGGIVFLLFAAAALIMGP